VKLKAIEKRYCRCEACSIWNRFRNNWPLSTDVDRLPSVRQRLSYGDCLEDEREIYQNCSVLYCVAQLCTIVCTLIWAVLTDELLYILVLYFFVLLFVLGLVISCLCMSSLLLFGCQYQCSRLPGNTRLQNDLFCVQWDVKPYTFSHRCRLRPKPERMIHVYRDVNTASSVKAKASSATKGSNKTKW